MRKPIPAAFAALCLCLAVIRSASAHPVPSENHDRVILVRLTPKAVAVEYRLEVDETRAGLDLPSAEKAKVGIENDLPATFCRYFGDVLAGNLVAELDGKPLSFRCISNRPTLLDEFGRKLGHLRCDYRMEAAWELAPDTEHKFTFRESNYELENFNRLHVGIATVNQVQMQAVIAPDAALLARKPSDFLPGDSNRIREVAATFRIAALDPVGVYRPALPPDVVDLKSAPEDADGADLKSAPKDAAAVLKGKTLDIDVSEAKPFSQKSPQSSIEIVSPNSAEPVSPAGANGSREIEGEEHSWSLLHLFLDTKQGIGLMLLFAAAFGAVHALTPGHGKTLVAAYLVGERGTVWHALLLGLVTTVTHTAAVILIAAALLFFPNTNRASVQTILELCGGGLVLSLGFWLLYTRLTDRADHVHLGGGHHHHHGHGHHDHDHVRDHDHHHHGEMPNAVGGPGVWALLILGFKGGMVPCWDAIAMLIFAISAGRLWLGLPLLLAFSAGLAGVLTGLGIGVVHARNFAGSRFQQGKHLKRFFRALPLLSAIAITLVGLWLCYDGLHTR